MKNRHSDAAYRADNAVMAVAWQNKGSAQDNLTDLLTDLRHWARFHKISFVASEDAAFDRYHNELELEKHNAPEGEI